MYMNRDTSFCTKLNTDEHLACVLFRMYKGYILEFWQYCLKQHHKDFQQNCNMISVHYYVWIDMNWIEMFIELKRKASSFWIEIIFLSIRVVALILTRAKLWHLVKIQKWRAYRLPLVIEDVMLFFKKNLFCGFFCGFGLLFK